MSEFRWCLHKIRTDVLRWKGIGDLRRWRGSPAFVSSGSGVVLAHGLVDGAVDIRIDGLALLHRVRLNDFLLALGHAELYFIVVVIDILIHSALLRF